MHVSFSVNIEGNDFDFIKSFHDSRIACDLRIQILIYEIIFRHNFVTGCDDGIRRLLGFGLFVSSAGFVECSLCGNIFCGRENGIQP